MSFYFFSKLGWLLIQPLNFCLFVTFAALLLQGVAPRAGRAVALVAILALMGINFSPVGDLILRPLEQRFPGPAADAPAPYGIVVLGGAINDALTQRYGQVDLQDGASRLTEAALLAKRYPNAKVFYTGGSADPPGGKSLEAAEARDLWVGLGIAPDRIGLETRSRNTYENARFSAAILRPQPSQTWLLVTSAYHMPRSMGLFRKAGFDVVAYPVDYDTFGDVRDYDINPLTASELGTFTVALHEWIGLTAYYLTGKIDVWFPAP